MNSPQRPPEYPREVWVSRKMAAELDLCGAGALRNGARQYARRSERRARQVGLRGSGAKARTPKRLAESIYLVAISTFLERLAEVVEERAISTVGELPHSTVDEVWLEAYTTVFGAQTG